MPLNDITETGKFFQIVVPDFATTPKLTTSKSGSTWSLDSGNVSMTSFLRLGTIDAANEPGAFPRALLDVIDAASPPNHLLDKAQAAAQTERNKYTTATLAHANAIANAAATVLGIASDQAANALMYAAASAALDPSQSATDQLDAVVAAVALAPFVDDARNRGDNAQMSDANGHRLTIAQRIKESNRLLTKGGWRDHSDGNRVSTTYGDKVEVVRGNYRMIVLGRQDDPSMAAVSDISGGLVDNADIGPGSIMEIKWVETQDGTWRSIESTTKADTESFFYGHVREVILGGSFTTITGREDVTAVTMTKASAAAVADMKAEFAELQTKDASLLEDAYIAQRGYTRQGNDYLEARYEENANGSSKRNPIIYERTWAETISEYVGSSTTPVPTIISETYASSITEKTYAANITGWTEAVGEINETTLATTITDTTGSASSKVTTITEQVYATTINTKTGDWGTKVSTLNEEVHSELRHCLWEGVNTECNMGLFAECFLGAAFSVRIGVPSVELSIAAAAEIFLGISLEFFAGLNIDVSLGVGLEIDKARTYIGLNKVKLELEQDEISAVHNKIAAITNLV